LSELITKFSFDLTNKTALIEYFLNSTKVSEWLYQGEMVSVEERTEPAQVSVEQALELARVTGEWVSIIRRYFEPPLGVTSKFEYCIEKDESNVTAKLIVNGVGIVNNDVWNKTTQMITYFPRPALNLTWTDYIVLWRGVHRDFNDTIMNFFGDEK